MSTTAFLLVLGVWVVIGAATSVVMALAAHADVEGFEVLAVGSREHGAAKAPLGSTATELARGTSVPVLVVTGERPAGREQERATPSEAAIR